MATGSGTLRRSRKAKRSVSTALNICDGNHALRKHRANIYLTEKGAPLMLFRMPFVQKVLI